MLSLLPTSITNGLAHLKTLATCVNQPPEPLKESVRLLKESIDHYDRSHTFVSIEGNLLKLFKNLNILTDPTNRVKLLDYDHKNTELLNICSEVKTALTQYIDPPFSKKPKALKNQLDKLFTLLHPLLEQKAGIINRCSRQIFSQLPSLDLLKQTELSDEKVELQHPLINVLKHIKRNGQNTPDLYEALYALETKTSPILTGLTDYISKSIYLSNPQTPFDQKGFLKDCTQFLSTQIITLSKTNEHKDLEECFNYFRQLIQRSSPIESSQRSVHTTYCPICILCSYDSPSIAPAIQNSDLPTVENAKNRFLSLEDEKDIDAIWVSLAYFFEQRELQNLSEKITTPIQENFHEQCTYLTEYFAKITVLKQKIWPIPFQHEEDLRQKKHLAITCIALVKTNFTNLPSTISRENDPFAVVDTYLSKDQHLEALTATQSIVEEYKLMNWGKAEQFSSPQYKLTNMLCKISLYSPTHPCPTPNECIKTDNIESERKQIVNNTSCSVSFHALSTFLRLQPDTYQKLIDSIELILEEDKKCENGDLKGKIICSIKKLTGKKPSDVSIHKIFIALNEIKKTEYVSHNKQSEIREILFFCFTDAILDQIKDISIFTKVIGRFILTIVYKLTQWFMQQVTVPLFKLIQEKIVLPPNGVLNETHLSILKAVGNALDAYSQSKQAWAIQKEKQNNGEIFPQPDKVVIGSNKVDALKKILNNPLYYGGIDPRDVDKKFGNYVVKHFLKISSFSLPASKLYDTINHEIDTPLITSPKNNFEELINKITRFTLKLLAIFPKIIIFIINYFFKSIIKIINFITQRLVTYIIWRRNIITNLLEDITKSLLSFTRNIPLIDELILGQLELLNKKCLQNNNEEQGSSLEHEPILLKRQLEEIVALFLETIELDKKSTSQELKDMTSDESRKILQKLINLKEPLADLLFKFSQSCLDKAHIDTFLLKILKTTNQNLKGKVSLLKPSEMDDLRKKLGQDPDNADIERQFREIQAMREIKIKSLMKSILKDGVSPIASRKITQFFKDPSDHLLDFISWIEQRLLSYPAQSSPKNIIDMLTHSLDDTLLQIGDPSQKKAKLLKIHEDYMIFLQEFIAKQAYIDETTIPNALKLNQFLNNTLLTTNPALETLTEQLQSFIKKSEHNQSDVDSIKITLQTIKSNLNQYRSFLHKIKQKERANKQPKNTEVVEFSKKAILNITAKNPIVPTAQKLLQQVLHSLASDTHATLNPTLIKHVTRHLMLYQLEGRA